MWLYAAIRPRYGPGPKTAALAGLALWVNSVMVHVIWVVFAVLPPNVLVGPEAANLPVVIVGAVAGALQGVSVDAFVLMGFQSDLETEALTV